MRENVVVVGAGMVGHRFVDELAGDDRFNITLIGAEEYAPYNRILLSDVLAGRTDFGAIVLPEPHSSVDFRQGVSAVGIDRERGVVLLSDGTEAAFDKLVLATGARAFVPPIGGLESKPKHVHVLRSIDDCRDIAARAMNAKHAVVVGGGLLGLEAACGLRRRGVPVTVVDLFDRPMATQLDHGPARALTSGLRDLGVDVRTETSVSEVISAYGEIVAVKLTDETVLAADLLLLSCGIRPESGIAGTAGLTVDRGIVVDDDLATDDPRIFAIGDCAQPPQGMTGLLAPGWRQAERLAASFKDDPALVEFVEAKPQHTEIVKLKAAGLDLVQMGIRADQAHLDDNVITLSDAKSGRHVDLIVRGDKLVGVTCVGMPDLSPSLLVTFERGTPIPVDAMTLLVPEPEHAQPSPFSMPGSTTVCRCNTVTKNDIVHAWEDGCDTVTKVASATRATTGCGGCTETVCGLVDWLNESDPSTPVGTSLMAPRSGVLGVAKS